nr:hypothetical protein [Candidatus Sigynarchaeota archaeon]
LVLLHPLLLPSILPSHLELNFLGGSATAIPIFFVVYSFCDFPGMIVKIVFGFSLVKAKILKPVGEKLVVPYYQMGGAMAIVFGLMLFFNGGLVVLFNTVISFGSFYKYIMAGLYLLLVLFVIPFLMFFLYSLAGGWDDYGLSIFKDAVELSGPSKFLVRKLYLVCVWGHDHSPLKNKFPIHHEAAAQEITELDELKRKTYESLK